MTTYKVLPAHARTVYVRTEKYNLYIPTMILIQEYKLSYNSRSGISDYQYRYKYFPVDRELKTAYYSPFLNTLNNGAICLGSDFYDSGLEYKLDVVLDYIYRSTWDFSMVDDYSAEYYDHDVYNYDILANFITRYYKFLQKWQDTKHINLIINHGCDLAKEIL